MITLTHPVTLEQRREVLEDLVGRWDEMPAGARNRMLHEVSALRGEALWMEMKTLIEAIHTADDLDSGELSWDQYLPELSGRICDDRQHEAWVIACSQVADAMTVLLRNPVATP